MKTVCDYSVYETWTAGSSYEKQINVDSYHAYVLYIFHRVIKDRTLKTWNKIGEFLCEHRA